MPTEPSKRTKPSDQKRDFEERAKSGNVSYQELKRLQQQNQLGPLKVTAVRVPADLEPFDWEADHSQAPKSADSASSTPAASSKTEPAPKP